MVKGRWFICLPFQFAWALPIVCSSYREHWNEPLGVVYIPWEKVSSVRADITSLSQGSVLDPATIPPSLREAYGKNYRLDRVGHIRPEQQFFCLSTDLISGFPRNSFFFLIHLFHVLKLGLELVTIGRMDPSPSSKFRTFNVRNVKVWNNIAIPAKVTCSVCKHCYLWKDVCCLCGVLTRV